MSSKELPRREFTMIYNLPAKKLATLYDLISELEMLHAYGKFKGAKINSVFTSYFCTRNRICSGRITITETSYISHVSYFIFLSHFPILIFSNLYISSFLAFAHPFFCVSHSLFHILVQ